MSLAACEFSADLHDKYRAVLLGDERFALLGSLVGIHIFEFLSCDEENVLIYRACDRRIAQTDLALSIRNRLHYRLYSLF